MILQSHNEQHVICYNTNLNFLNRSVLQQVGLLFFFSIFWGFFPLNSAIFVFPQERPMLIKERSSGMYRLCSYYFARMAGDLPMELVLPTIFVTITYWMGGLKPSLITFLLTLAIILLNVLVAQSLGLVLGAVIMDVKQATTLASVTMLVFLLAGGYYIQHIPPFIAWMKYISFSHYCYKLLVEVQYSANEVYECGSGLHCSVMEFPAIKLLELGNKWWDVGALTIMLVGYRVLAYVVLRMRRPHWLHRYKIYMINKKFSDSVSVMFNWRERNYWRSSILIILMESMSSVFVEQYVNWIELSENLKICCPISWNYFVSHSGYWLLWNYSVLNLWGSSPKFRMKFSRVCGTA